MRRLLILTCAVAVTASLILPLALGGEADAHRARYEANLRKWQELSPERKAELRRAHEQWSKLTPEERQLVQQTADRLKKLSPEQREQLREGCRRWRQMPPEKREAMKQRFHKFGDRIRRMPHEHRSELRSWAHDLRDLPPEQRQEHKRELRRFFRLSKDEQLPMLKRMRQHHGSRHSGDGHLHHDRRHRTPTPPDGEPAD